ncbi:hypothetical protein BDV26DRAFT_65630 [Aspergillus bertholletiae]|uniref:NACHT domain-containing protein n=1 Tax=Aspergillus bertholletiae TaxID=1226010 RepID=A0A5N7BJ21_9EURO|nr:hypothetical protein BDV26DRAFT_65630 [Aspergillus bertholletiae]
MPLRRRLRKLYENRKENKTSSSPPPSPRPSTIETTQLIEPFKPQGLWQAAYNQLDKEKRRILSTLKDTADPNDEENRARIEDLIDQVIHLTKEQYEEYQRNADGKIRKYSRNIIDAALSTKDIIGAVATFDPTQHAASAWAIVSLGLTMTKNYRDQRDALFESSDYLADVLAQCAFVEQNFYRESRSGNQQNFGNILIRLYRAILSYTAAVQQTQSASKGKKLLDCVSAITGHPFTELKALVEEERKELRRRIELDKYFCHREEAEYILSSVDKLTDCMKELLELSVLANLRVAEGAFYNSYVNQHEDFCLPDTRTKLQEEILKWAESDDKFIFWLNGMAGTGKSTIARTVAQSFEKHGLLGASFFFKRGEADRGNAKYLMSTITRQLVIRHRQLGPDVLNAIKNDPNIASKSLGEQCEKLLCQPLVKLHLDQPTTIVIVIDALDECDGEDDIRVILRLLFKMQEIKSVRLRVFLTSRPELPIRLGFEQDNNHQDLVLHALPAPVVEHDIRVFLEYKLSEIQHERKLSSNWPGHEIIEKLVQISLPLFATAATICRFLNTPLQSPERSLNMILSDPSVVLKQPVTNVLPVKQPVAGAWEGSDLKQANEAQDAFSLSKTGKDQLEATEHDNSFSGGRCPQVPKTDPQPIDDHKSSRMAEGIHSSLSLSEKSDNSKVGARSSTYFGDNSRDTQTAITSLEENFTCHAKYVDDKTSDARSIYSERTNLTSVDSYISDIARTLFQYLESELTDISTLDKISGVLAQHLKSFAVLLGYEVGSQDALDAMIFIRHYRE